MQIDLISGMHREFLDDVAYIFGGMCSKKTLDAMFPSVNSKSSSGANPVVMARQLTTDGFKTEVVIDQLDFKETLYKRFYEKVPTPKQLTYKSIGEIKITEDDAVEVICNDEQTKDKVKQCFMGNSGAFEEGAKYPLIEELEVDTGQGSPTESPIAPVVKFYDKTSASFRFLPKSFVEITKSKSDATKGASVKDKVPAEQPQK